MPLLSRSPASFQSIGLARPLPALLVGLAILLAGGCARRSEEPGAGGGGAAKGRAVTVKGSDTMVILVQRWAEKYMSGHQGATIQVTGGGSGTGIAALVNGTTDICASSRPMKDTEKTQLRDGRKAEAKEIPVALDALAIYVHESNSIPSLTIDQLKSIYTGAVTNWKDVGGTNAPIILYGRENSSGTYGYFKEHVLANADFAAATQTLPGTAAVSNAVASDPKAIGYGGIAYAKGIRLVPVAKAPEEPPVEANMENALSGKYPISRFLFFYTAGEPTGEAAAFIQWVLGADGQAVIQEVGYFPLPKA